MNTKTVSSVYSLWEWRCERACANFKIIPRRNFSSRSPLPKHWYEWTPCVMKIVSDIIIFIILIIVQKESKWTTSMSRFPHLFGLSFLFTLCAITPSHDRSNLPNSFLLLLIIWKFKQKSWKHFLPDTIRKVLICLREMDFFIIRDEYDAKKTSWHSWGKHYR